MPFLSLFSVSLLFTILAASAFANPALDSQYSFRRIVPIVLSKSLHEIYTTEVEKEIAGAIRNNPRFDFADESFVWVKDRVKAVKRPQEISQKTDALKFLEPVFKELTAKGVDSVVVADIEALTDEAGQIRTFLVNTADGNILHSSNAIITERRVLDSYKEAARNAVSDLVANIPFDANILKREGARVVLDRGYNRFRKGMRVPAVTMEKTEHGIVFVETGAILITQAERSLSFGKIQVENLPQTVQEGNKIKAGPMPSVAVMPIARGIASELPATTIAGVEDLNRSRMRIGTVDFSISPTMMDIRHVLVDETEMTASALLAMSARAKAEVWITSQIYWDAMMAFGTGSITAISSEGTQPSKLFQLRSTIGYRYALGHPNDSLNLFVKTGFNMQRLSLGLSTTSTFFTSMSHSGLWVGGGARYPLSDINGVELELGTMVLGGFTEEPFVSGETVLSAANWEASFRYYHRIQQNLDLGARLVFNFAGARYDGIGNRVVNATDLEQMNKALLVGATYFF